VVIATCLAFLAGFALLCYWLMNKPTHVDFLIATDSEMKKVNWTSRKELIGSTKVVVVFMFLIAFLLFLIDQIFHLLFWAVGVLKTKPPFWP
jgi:preprotein translocase SecE subunit